jgi:hypothetical protein
MTMAKMTSEQRHQLYALVFGTPEGARVLADIEREAGCGRSGYHPDGDRQTTYNLGRQALGYWIGQAVRGPEQREVTNG